MWTLFRAESYGKKILSDITVWSPKDIEHWTTVIDKRTRSAQSRKEAKLATREDNLTSEEGGIG